MNRFKINLAVIMVTFFYSSYSQINNFNLSDYKLPDMERRALETNFNVSGSNNFAKTPNTIYYGVQDIRTNQYNSNIFVNYHHYLNSIKYQKESNIGLHFSSDYYNRKYDKDVTYKNSRMEPLLNYQSVNRNYYNSKNFFETDFVFNYQYGRNNSFNKYVYDSSETKENLQTHTILATLPLKFGKGRIEQVQDARHAVYLFDELNKVDRVSSDKTNEDIIEFAELISKLKNKRFFDSRLRRIAEIESVDSFLRSKNYLSKSDAKYFTTLQDFWDYGNRPLRNSGTRISGAMLPSYYYYYENNTVDSYSGKNKLNAFLLDGGIEIKHEKPINLIWQNSIDFNGYVGIIEGKVNDITNSVEDKIRIPNMQLGFYQTIGYYPNTRTDMSFGYSAQYVQLFDKTDEANEILGVEGKGLKATTDLSINYYISPKFRLNARSSFYYIWQDSEDEVIINFDNVAGSNYLMNTINGYSSYYKEKEIQNSFSISLVYTIF